MKAFLVSVFIFVCVFAWLVSDSDASRRQAMSSCANGSCSNASFTTTTYTQFVPMAAPYPKTQFILLRQAPAVQEATTPRTPELIAPPAPPRAPSCTGTAPTAQPVFEQPPMVMMQVQDSGDEGGGGKGKRIIGAPFRLIGKIFKRGG